MPMIVVSLAKTIVAENLREVQQINFLRAKRNTYVVDYTQNSGAPVFYKHILHRIVRLFKNIFETHA